MDCVTLSQDGQYGTFNGFPATHLFTTNLFGDLAKEGTQEARCLEKIGRLLGAEKILKIIPEHSDNVRLSLSAYAPGAYVVCDGIIAIAGNGIKQALVSGTADCPTIIYYYQDSHPDIGIRSIVHSGWKGTSLNIAGRTVKEIAQLHAQLSELKKASIRFNYSGLYCALWTGICADCYAVGPEFAEIFPKDYANGKVGLSGAIRRQLIEAGVPDSNILCSGVCPHCAINPQGNPLFASHRRGDKFRNALAVVA